MFEHRQRLHNQQNEKEKKEVMAINKCGSDNWQSKIHKFLQFGITTVNFIIKSKITFVYIKGF